MFAAAYPCPTHLGMLTAAYARVQANLEAKALACHAKTYLRVKKLYNIEQRHLFYGGLNRVKLTAKVESKTIKK